MTDEELIARLRYEADTDGYDYHGDLHEKSADRIEALIEESGRRLALARSEGVARVEQFERNEALTEQRDAARQDAKEAEAYAEELEKDRDALEAKLALMMTERDEAWKRAAHSEKMWGEAEVKLAKAVDLAIEECPFRHGTPRYNDWWHHRRATLAEIKGT